MQNNYSIKSVRASSVLTGSYVAGTVIGPRGLNPSIDPVSNNQLVLYFDFTLGSLTSAELKVEFSDDGVNYYQETTSSLASGTSTDKLTEHTISATGKYRLAFQICDRYIRVSVKGTGTVTNSLLAIDAIIATRI